MSARRPDSPEGARAVLREDAEIDDARVRPDPNVEGVWEVQGDGWRAIVYLAGYKNPWGVRRDFDDYEYETEEER